ncbi:MAG TPA: hypothetical protein VNA29_04150 [Sphingomicrobium sp.]|nr:hypothetical protein [Sphingomicrobium sp.]
MIAIVVVVALAAIFPAVVAAVTITVDPGRLIVAMMAAEAVPRITIDAIFKPSDATLDLVGLTRANPAIGGAPQTILKDVDFAVESNELAPGKATLELVDTVVQLVDARLKAANLAVIMLITVALRLRIIALLLRREPLGRGGSRGGQSGGRNGGGNEELTHRGSPSSG